MLEVGRHLGGEVGQADEGGGGAELAAAAAELAVGGKRDREVDC